MGFALKLGNVDFSSVVAYTGISNMTSDVQYTEFRIRQSKFD